MPKNVTIVSTVSTPESAHAKTRNKVKRHKDALLNSMPARKRQIVRQLCIKLLRDYKDVSSKRGTKNFNLKRWLKSNT